MAKLINGKDITVLNKTELLELKVSIELELDEIKDQLKRAEAHQKTTGEYADPHWYWSAVRARKHKARQVQDIQLEIRKHNDINKNNQKLLGGRSFPNRFMDIARQYLPQKDFDELLMLTRQEIENDKLRKAEVDNPGEIEYDYEC